MDVATDFLMGRSTHTLNSSSQAERNQQFIDDYMLCSEYAARRMNLGPLSPLHRDATANQASRRVLQYMDDYIDESLKMDHKDPQTDHNYIQDLATAVGNRKTLRDHVLHLLLASRDTTATLLSNLFFALAKKPLVYAKLREEVVRTFGDKVPTFEQLKDMQYLKWCINESLRLHPVIPENAREAIRNTTLPRGGGKDGNAPLFVRKGAILFYSMYAMHRDSDVYGDNIEEFVPERWDGLRPGWSFLPFSGGPRLCIGQNLALLEAYYVVTRLVQRVGTLESCDEREWMDNPALVTTCANGVHVRLNRPDTCE
ncbi:hypothetical protein ACO1O0_006859 [Amphichorda felina]